MILVVGATGIVGRMVTEQLLAEGREVRILARPGSDYHTLADAGAQVVHGDLKDPSSLETACEGIATLISTANSAARGGEDNAESVDRHGNRNLIEAAEEAGVKRFVFLSALGVSADSPIPFFQAKAETEQRLRESSMEWTILAPNLFMESWAMGVVGGPIAHGQPVTLVGSADRKHSFISAGDVAKFAVAVVDGEAARNEYLPLGGPEPLSWRDVVSVFERVLGRDVETRFVQPGEPVPGLSDTMVAVLAATDTYDSALDTAPLAAELGIELTPLESVVRRNEIGA